MSQDRGPYQERMGVSGGPVVRILGFPCCGPGSILGLGTEMP